MGLTVSVFLIGLLYVGISAIAGLEVSYMAFNKEVSYSSLTLTTSTDHDLDGTASTEGQAAIGSERLCSKTYVIHTEDQTLAVVSPTFIRPYVVVSGTSSILEVLILWHLFQFGMIRKIKCSNGTSFEKSRPICKANAMRTAQIIDGWAPSFASFVPRLLTSLLRGSQPFLILTLIGRPSSRLKISSRLACASEAQRAANRRDFEKFRVTIARKQPTAHATTSTGRPPSRLSDAPSPRILQGRRIGCHLDSSPH